MDELEKNNTKVEAREMKFEPETFESEAANAIDTIDEVLDAVREARFEATVTFESLEAKATSDDAIGLRSDAIVTFESLKAMGMTCEAKETKLEMSDVTEVRGASGMIMRSKSRGM